MKGTSSMKKRNPLTKLTLLLALLLTLGVAQARADILPMVGIGFAPFGLTMDQTARLNLVNIDLPNGMLVYWRFIDASGLPVKQATVTLPLGKTVKVDFKRTELPGDPPTLIRAEVRAQVYILSAGASDKSLRRSLEVAITANGITYNPADDFSATMNPNDPWTFGYTAALGGLLVVYDATFTTHFTSADEANYWYRSDHPNAPQPPSAGHNPNGAFFQAGDAIDWAANGFHLHPGPSGEYSVARWTASTSGMFDVNAVFTMADDGYTDVHLLHNSVSIFDDAVIGRGDSSSFSTVVSVTAGDTIDFSVGSAGSYYNDSTDLVASISSTTLASVATDDFYGVSQASSLSVPAPGILTNDNDAANSPLTAELVTGPANGASFQLNPDGSFTYTPLAYFYGEDSFTYRAYNGTEYSEIATVHITVSQPGSMGFITGGGKFFQDDRKCAFGFVAKLQGSGVQGNLEFQDHDASMDVSSEAMQTVYAANSTDGYFSGTCTVNAADGYTFFVQIHDRGEPGRNDDFTIWIFDSLYSAGALLSGGNIVIHGN